MNGRPPFFTAPRSRLSLPQAGAARAPSTFQSLFPSPFLPLPLFPFPSPFLPLFPFPFQFPSQFPFQFRFAGEARSSLTDQTSTSSSPTGGGR
jgi:hypothetical protein